MKRTHSSLFRCVLLTAALFATAAGHEASARDSTRSLNISAARSRGDARLIIYRSPKLGVNVPLAIRIDGQPAGGLLWGQTFDKRVAPGQRLLLALPVTAPHRAWEAMLDLRPGHTYALIATNDGNYLVLRPTIPRTR